jgi:hypothetical protein
MGLNQFALFLVKIVAAVGIAIAGLAEANAARDACAVLTAADVSSAVGHPVGPPTPSQNGEGGGKPIQVGRGSSKVVFEPSK